MYPASASSRATRVNSWRLIRPVQVGADRHLCNHAALHVAVAGQPVHEHARRLREERPVVDAPSARNSHSVEERGQIGRGDSDASSSAVRIAFR